MLRAPFPYFGGKSRIAAEVWRRFGDVKNYVEPFAGSAAVLLSRPDKHQWWLRHETINDADGFVANFWRALRSAPDEVAMWADWPVSEADLHARHAWLVGQRPRITEALMADPHWFDAKVAGWWVWGISQWIGGAWCSADGVASKRRPHLSGSGMGVHRKIPYLFTGGQGVHRMADAIGCDEWTEHIRHIMRQLADRLRRVRVCCGDWSRVCGPSPTWKMGLTGVFLDPPYSVLERADDLYAVEMHRADDVREWAIANGGNPLMRIALCGYDGEHDMPPGWVAFRWSTSGGYGNQGGGRGMANRHREVVWFSPHCLNPNDAQLSLFDSACMDRFTTVS